MLRGLILTAALALLAACATARAEAPTEANLRAADAEQMRIIVERDAVAQEAFMHPNYMVNTPANMVVRKAQIVQMLASGVIASDSFERTVEAVQITGDVGIVMGREVVTPTPTSELGRLHPGQTLNRRYTNVFLWEDGRWRFLARQASVVAP